MIITVSTYILCVYGTIHIPQFYVPRNTFRFLRQLYSFISVNGNVKIYEDFRQWEPDTSITLLIMTLPSKNRTQDFFNHLHTQTGAIVVLQNHLKKQIIIIKIFLVRELEEGISSFGTLVNNVDIEQICEYLSYLDLVLEYDNLGNLKTPISRFSFSVICSNTPLSHVYVVYNPQLISYVRLCLCCRDFLNIGKLLTSKLLSQCYIHTKLFLYFSWPLF